MKHLFIMLLLTVFMGGAAQAQQKTAIDTVKLDSVIIKEGRSKNLPDQSGTYLFSGKKTNVIYADPGKANLSGNVARTLFAQVPGINVWEMDGAGLQLNIGTRGTDMHRSIETNIRQNGYNTNSDVFGYPENHYNMPFQAIGEVQYVRGSAALQFGDQFGGMVNFKIKEPDTTKTFGLESEQTIGANRFFNTYNAIGGKVVKISYYAYFDARNGDGWRPNSKFNYHAFYAHIKYQFNSKGSLAFEFSRSDYVQQIAGGLTDAQFALTSRQSNRSRNFFNPVINIPALLFNYNFSKHTKLEVTSHMLAGQRNSVQFIATPNVSDTVNTALKTYNPRQVDRDYYKSFTTEARLATSYLLGGHVSTLSTGVRYSNTLTKRLQKGVGTTASDFDLSLVKDYGVDTHLKTDNYAAFVENLFRISKRLSFTPGARLEVIKSNLTGLVNNRNTPIDFRQSRNFPLFGAGLQYQVSNSSQLYGNVSQAYRPYLYAAVVPADQHTIVDQNIKDSRGYDIDLGYRGRIVQVFTFDVNAFYVKYNNRAGTLTITDNANVKHLYLTNIGNAISKGLEAYTELSLLRGFNLQSGTDIMLFNTLAYTHARYVTGAINVSGVNNSLVGNQIEGTPTWTNRTGLTFLSGAVTSTVLFSYVGKNFSDANNTAFNPTGASGVVPAYHLIDWSFNYNFLKNYHVNFHINNLLNEKYFTRRINMYPGPGILPGDGRSFNVGLGVKI
ncbi:TonB-dependent receptor family protein [Mucilaginibacter psychrotolerans]|uniref:TonB-dependent receptor n=1 Tax=Mucilaginibacter psychrotolerans TaxID=1524096 RepID=A0A4Y8SIJ0_9SPHI|nr:TonB-dependent receptor [Mucilaginibacter psychrotolerans]TFF38849.1 TonB-dependent receptor [Mucilaginibacter psychrotolerans]